MTWPPRHHILFEGLRDIVLVAYSYGGAVVTAALAHVADRIHELVYLDAFVPGDGDTVAGLSGRTRSSLIGLGDEWLVPPPERHCDDPDEAVWQTARRVPHPSPCFTDPVRLARPVEDYAFGLTYIKATADSREAPGGNAFRDAAEHAEASSRWRYREIATDHMVASNRPRELATLLIDISNMPVS